MGVACFAAEAEEVLNTPQYHVPISKKNGVIFSLMILGTAIRRRLAADTYDFFNDFYSFSLTFKQLESVFERVPVLVRVLVSNAVCDCVSTDDVSASLSPSHRAPYLYVAIQVFSLVKRTVRVATRAVG